MARPGDWSPLGLHGDPTPGDLDILTSLHQEMEDLGELASEVNSGLDRVLNTSTDGFIGKTAEAVRKKVDGHLKKFINSVGHSFSVSAPATLDYLNGIRDAQAKADQALAAAQGLSQDDPKLVALKAQVHDAADQYATVCRTYGDKLWHAGKIEQPISGWQLFLQALGILAIILAILGAIFGGWVGLIALAVNVALLIKTAVEFAEGKASVLDLVLAVIGVLFPSTKGLNIGQLGKGLFNALKNLPSKIAGGISNFGKGVTHFFTEGLTFKSVFNGLLKLPGLILHGATFVIKTAFNSPSLVWNGLKAIGGIAWKGMQLAWGGLKMIGSALKNDFHLATIGTNTTLGKIGVYAMSFGSRFVVSATLPLDFFELGIGARAAIKMGLGTRLSTPWSHLSQPIVGGGLHVGALAGSHTTFHAANGTTGFSGFDHAASSGFNANGLTGLHSAGTSGLGALHGLNTGVNVGGLHNLSALDSTVHLGAGVTPSSVSHAMANVGGGASAFDHLTAFDHATGFERSSSGLLGPLNAGFSTGHVGMSHIGSMTTGSVTSHAGAASVHGLRTDLTGSATGLHTAISDSMSGIRGAAGHVADFHAIGISELKSIVDGDISALKMTPDGVSMHIGAQSGTPTALHMNLRTMSLTDGAGHQITVAPEAHAALGTTGTDVAPGAVHSAPPASTSIKEGASTTFTDIKATGATHNGSASVSVTDVKAPGAATHNAPPPSADIKTGGTTRNLDELSGGAKSFDEAGKFAEGPGSHAVTVQGDHLGVSAHDLDLLGRRDGTGDTAGAAAPAVHETEALAGAVQVAPTHIAVRPESGPHTGGTGDAVRPPRSRFEAITGGVGGRIGAERMHAWNNYEKAVGDAVRAEGDLHGLGGALDKPSETIDQAAAKLDAQQVGLGVDAARQDLARLDMDVDAIQARLDQLGGAPKGHPGGDLGSTGAHNAGSLETHGLGGESSLSKLEKLSAPDHGPGGVHDGGSVGGHGPDESSLSKLEKLSAPDHGPGGVHDGGSVGGHGPDESSLSKLEKLSAPSHMPERSPIESAPKAPTHAPSSGLSTSAHGYVDRLDGIAKDAGMSPADRSLYKQAINDAVQADDFRGVAHNYAQFRDHVELTTLNHRFDAFQTHIDQGFDRLGDLGVNRAEWQAKVDAVHDARATHEMDLQNAALRDYTAFVERHVPSEVLTGKDVPKAFDANLSRVLGDLSKAGGPGEYVRLREELSGLLELDGFQARLNALRGELGDEATALNARIGSSTTFDDGAAAVQALHDFHAEQDLAARLDALKSDFSGAAHASDTSAVKSFEDRLGALRGKATDPHEIELQRLFDEAVGGEDQGRALANLHDYRETRDFQARLDALRHDDAGAEHIDESVTGTHLSDDELADRFAALGHGDHPHVVELRQEAHAAGSAEESEKILDKLHAFQDKQEVKRQEHVIELREKIDSLTADRNAHLLNDRFDQAGHVGKELDRLNLELDHTLTAGEKRAELFSEFGKNVDRPEAAGHLDRIVDKGLSVSAAEHAAGAGGDAERSFADIEKLFNSLPDTGAHPAPHVHSGDGPDLGGARPGHGDEGAGGLKLPDTPHTPPSSSETHVAGTHTGDLHSGDLHGGDLHNGDLHTGDLHGGDVESGAGKGGKAAGDTPPPRVTEPGSHELTLEAPKERPESGATTAPDLGGHSVPSALSADELRVLRGGHDPVPGNAVDSALHDLPSEKVPSGTGAGVHEHEVPSGIGAGMHEHQVPSGTGAGVHEHQVPSGTGAGVHEHQVPPTRVDLHPQWNEARETAVPKTVDRSWVDPVSTPMGQGAHAPRYQVTAGFDVRQFKLGEKNVTDVTVRVDLAGAAGVAAHEIEAVWQRAELGIERIFNAPGHELPNGNLLHVTVERADGAAGGSHLKVEVGGPKSTIDQHHWSVEATEQDLAHEFGHQLGFRDEYPGEGALHRPAVDGSLMGNYHNPSLDGLSHGGIRDRYLHVLQDHIASVDGASAAHGAGVHTGDTPSFVAPHAPKGSGSKVAVKSGRGGPSTAGASLSENLKFDTEITRFGGSKDFQRALGNYQIKPLAQYDGLAKGVTGTGDGVRFVATVPATADTDLLKLAQKYGEGFADGSAQGEHFGLVIGINGRGDKAADIKQAVEDFAKEWDKNGTFPVAVTGFTWKQPDSHLVAQGAQKEIPYGAIRETIVRDDLTSQMIKKLWPGDGSSGDMYLHIGDADVHSLKVGDKPLFDTAGDLLSDMKKAGKDLPEVLSGGYKLPGAESVKTIGKNGKPLKGPEVAEAKKTADAVAAAADLDLKVRAAMAKVDARTVYFPEPNTFVKVNSDSGLENGISFGEIAGKDTFHYEAKEGQYLVDSVVKTRHAEWDILGPKVAPKIVSFDPSLALVTDAGRIGANVKDDVASLLHGLTQSHASRKTWTDQMDHYLTQHHPDLAKPDVSKALADIAFHDIRTDGRLQTPTNAQRAVEALGGKEKFDAFRSGYSKEVWETFKTTLVPMALNTRKALGDFLGVEKAVVSPKAPVAGGLHAGHGGAAGGDLTRDLSHTAQTQPPVPHGTDVHLSGNHELTVPPKERPGNAGTLDASHPVGPVPKPFDMDAFRATRADLGDTSAPGASLPDTALHDLPSQSPAVHTAVHESPQWHAVRAQAAPVTRDRIWMDPVSHPMGSGAHAPRYAVASAFDVRQFEVDGRSVTDLTVKVDLVGAVGVAAHEMDDLWDRALSGVDRVFNAPGHELPDGNVLHVTLERGDGVSGGVHVTVEVHGPDVATNQHQWSVGATDQDLAHEIGHQLGLRDEYVVKGADQRADVHGSLMGNYHEPAMEGMTQGGVRGRYLDLIHDHIGDLDDGVPAAVVHGIDVGGGVVSPHMPQKAKSAPKASTSKGVPQISVKAGRGGTSAGGATLSKQVSYETVPTRFTGSNNFRQAVDHYEIKPLVQYDGLAKGATGTGSEVRFVATVPATADVDLMKLADKYAEGFADGSAQGERFGLVIGINGRAGKEADIKKAVEDFAKEWDEKGTFPVAVTGFTWRQPDPHLVAQGTQKEIPYGAIRESIVRDDLTSRMIEKLRPAGSSAELYLHVGDADVHSMLVGGKPLFDRATAKLDQLGMKGATPEVLSGGYTLPGAVHAGEGAKTANAAKAAADLDLAVRQAVAKVDSRFVYFPEPNTFVKVGDANGLEKDISFGSLDNGRFTFEAKEGEKLVDSVIKQRGFTWSSPKKAAVFDSGLALVTDDGRIGAKVTADTDGISSGLTQSHASRGTWSDQMKHYVETFHPGLLAKDSNAVESLADMAFYGTRADAPDLAKTGPAVFGKALGGDDKWASFKEVLAAHPEVANIAFATRETLIGDLKKHTPQFVSAPAPSAKNVKASGSKVSVKAGRGGTSAGGATLSKQVSYETVPTRFTGSNNFRQAVDHYEIKPLVQYDGLAKGAAATGDGVRFVATVPVTADTDLLKLVGKYAEGFGKENAAGLNERFGLVIGINGRADKAADIKQAVEEFAKEWDEKGTFPVAVTGFTWKQPDGALVKQGTQKEIPYGAIRESIVRDDLTSRMIEKLWPGEGSSGDLYLHVGDADVQSMVVGDKPLFDRVTAKLGELANKNTSPDVLSGGYTLPGAVDAGAGAKTANAAKAAADLDLAVRQAVAKVDSRFVYFPEPNTFVRVDSAGGLEKDISFGTLDKGKFSFEAKEGEKFVDSVIKQRKFNWGSSPKKAAVFDSGLALVTDDGRIGAKVTADTDGISTGLTQSHAARGTWSDQMVHYLTQFHPELANPKIVSALADIAFYGTKTGALETAKTDAAMLGKALGGGHKWLELKKDLAGHPEVGNIAVATRDALVAELDKHSKLLLSAPAPTETGSGLPHTGHFGPSTEAVAVHGDTSIGGKRLDLDPRFHEARAQAAPKTLERGWTDPVSRPMGSGAHAPRYQVWAGFDARQFEVDGRAVTDLTIKVDLVGAGDAAAHEMDELWKRARSGVERIFNAPGHELGDGSLLHVTLERGDGAAGGAHLTVEVGGPKTAMNQHAWSVDASEQDLAHEIGHQLGLRDEYQAIGSEHRPDIDGSLMGNYHAPAGDGLVQGGVRGRYLQVLDSHMVSLDNAGHTGLAAGHAPGELGGIAPNMPTKAGGPSSGKSAVKGGATQTGGSSVPGTLTREVDPGRFGGSHDFQRAVDHYRITPVMQYESLTKGALTSGEGTRFVATVPATSKVDLLELARKYEAGFGPEHASALTDRFGLVIGINGRPGTEAAIKQQIEAFAKEWDKSGTFPVSVTGFTWHQPDAGLVAQGTQKEIPYGAIRESIFRDELTSRMIGKFRPGKESSGELYLHVGDADVASMVVGGKPLFDRAIAKLESFSRPPEVVSGGYTLPGAVHVAETTGTAKAGKGAKAVKAGKGVKANSAKAAADAVKADAAKAAAELDLKVRAAMAEVDARAVYFPEPNTFVRVDRETGLEKEIGFGGITGTGRFSFEALEGRALVDSVVATRKAGWESHASMAVFDPELALVTDDERIAAEVTGDGKTVLNGLTQSHATRKTWTDQMAHYITQHLAGEVQPSPGLLDKLSAIAFHDIHADGRALVKSSTRTPADALGGVEEWRSFAKENPAHVKLAKIAIKTRDALVDGLKKPETSVAVSPPAPVSVHGKASSSREAGPGTSHAVSPRAPQAHTTGTMVASSSRTTLDDFTITEVPRNPGERSLPERTVPVPEREPVRPPQESLLPLPPVRMTRTQQLSAADRILPSRNSPGTLADQLAKGLEDVLSKSERDALKADWKEELATEIWPSLSVMTRGEVRKLTMDVGGWTGEVEVSAKVVGADTEKALDSLEFEDGMESFVRSGFQREKLSGLTGGVLVKGKAAEKTDVTGQASVTWTSSDSHRVASSGRMFTRTKTAEPALTVGTTIQVEFDFSAVRGRFSRSHFNLAKGDAPAKTRMEVPLEVQVATSKADAGEIPDLAGQQHYLPPLRVEQTLALHGSDTLRDVFLVDANGERTVGRLDTALLGDPADPGSLAAFGRRTFGGDWDRIQQLVLGRLGSLDVLQFELKGMTAGEVVEIDLGEGFGTLLVTAEVSSMKQWRNTAKTEFNTGSDTTRVFTHGESSDVALRATLNAQSADLGAGPGSLTGTVHGQVDREGVSLHQESVRTGTAVKMKVPGVIFNGSATLSFTHRADPLGANPKGLAEAGTSVTDRPAVTTAETAPVRETPATETPAPGTTAPEITVTTPEGTTVAAHPATTTAAPTTTAADPVRSAKGAKATIGFQVLVDAAEARPVTEAGAFLAAERTAGPKRMEATHVEAGDIAWQPDAKVWEGLPAHTVVFDVLTGEEPAVGKAAAPAISDLVDGLGRHYFGSDWSELRPAAQDMAGREQLSATLPPMTRDTTARSAPLPMPLHSNAQLALTGKLESLEYVRTMDAAEVNLLSDVTQDASKRLNTALTHGEWMQGGVQPDIADDIAFGLHGGAAYGQRFRSGSGVGGGSNSVASAKYAEPMVQYIATVSVGADLGRPGDAAARTGATEVRFLVAFPKSHAESYAVAPDKAGHQVFTRPASVTKPAVPANGGTRTAGAADAGDAVRLPAATTGTVTAPLKFQPPERVTGGKGIGTGDVVLSIDDEAAMVKELKEQISAAFGDRWGQVEGDINLFFDGAVLQPKTAGLTAGEKWGSTFTAGAVTADIKITKAEAEMTEFLRTEDNFEFELGTESSAGLTASKDSSSRRTMWQRVVVKAPHTAVTLARMRHMDTLKGRSFDFRSGVVSKNKTVEPASLFKGRVTYTVEVKIKHAVPGFGSERTFTVGSDGEFAFPSRDLPIDPKTGAAPRPSQSFRPPRRIEDSQALGASDIVLNVSPLPVARTERPGTPAAGAVDGSAVKVADRPETAPETAVTRPAAEASATDIREAVFRQLDAQGPKVFGSAKGWRIARQKMMDRLPASEFQRRLKPMMAGQPWVVRVNGRQVIISASVKEMTHSANTKATEFNTAAVGVVGGARTEEHMGEPQVVSTGTNVTVVGTSDPLGAAPAEVFGGGTLAHTTTVEKVVETGTATRTAVGTKSKVPGSVFDGVAQLHFEFRAPWRPFGRTVDKRVAPGVAADQRHIGELRDALAAAMKTDPAGKKALDLRTEFDQALKDQTTRIQQGIDGKRPVGGERTSVFASMTKRAFSVRKHTFGDAEIGFQTVVESADAVKVAEAGAARFEAPRPGTVRPRPTKNAEAAPPVSMPKPPESIWTEGMSGGQLVRDLPDVRSLRTLLDTQGRKAYAGAWTHVTSNGTRRGDLVMAAFPEDRIKAALPQMTRGEELTSEPFLLNGQKAWVSAKAEVVGLSHHRPEAKAEVALATENSTLFSRRGLHSRQVYLVGQLGALASAAESKLGAALTFGGGFRRRTRGDQASGGRTFNNAKIPTPLEHFDGGVKITFTFHHGGGIAGKGAGVVPFGLSVPVAEITEHVTEAAGHVFAPPKPKKAGVGDAETPKAPETDTLTVEGAQNEVREPHVQERRVPPVDEEAAAVIPHEPVPEAVLPPPATHNAGRPGTLLRDVRRQPTIPEEPEFNDEHLLIEEPVPARELPRTGNGTRLDTRAPVQEHLLTGRPAPAEGLAFDGAPAHTDVIAPNPAPAHTDVIVPNQEPAHTEVQTLHLTFEHTDVPAPGLSSGHTEVPVPAEKPEPAVVSGSGSTSADTHVIVPNREPVIVPSPAPAHTETPLPSGPAAAGSTAGSSFADIRQQHPEPIARNTRWTMWGHSGPTAETSVYAVEFGALDLRGVYAPPAPGEGIGAWHWHVGDEAEPVAVTPLTLRSPGAPGEAAPFAGTGRPFVASEAAREPIGAALQAAPWNEGLHWRTDSEDLYVFGPSGDEAREAVFADGLRPSGDGLVHPVVHVRDSGDPGSAWVTASRDIGWLRGRAAGQEGATDTAVLGRYGWRYDIAAPGGVDVNGTLDLAAPHPERREVLYPGGVDSRWIRGAQRLDGGRPVGPYMINPGFVDTREPGTATEGTG